jgi:hypothetical protein
MALFSA